MNSLPDELIVEIFNHIQKITDKRQFLKTCIHYNNLTKQSFINFDNNYTIRHFVRYVNNCVEKFTLELCHDSYFNLIPDHYITSKNTELTEYLAFYNNLELLEVAKSKACLISNAMNFGALGGHIPIMEWCHENNCNDFFAPQYAAINGSINALKWLRDHGHTYGHIVCTFAARNGQLEVIKYLHEIGCPWDKTVFESALISGNTELTKFLIDNGCPT